MVKRLPKPLSSKTKKQWLNILQSGAERKNPGAPNSQLRVVIDTNIWYSAIVHGGNAEKVSRYCLDNAEIVLSSEIIEELNDLLRNQIRLPYRWINSFLRSINDLCEIYEVRDDVFVDTIIRDPNDTHIIAAASQASCDIIVTGDKDLLCLEKPPVLIVSPTEFIELLQI